MEPKNIKCPKCGIGLRVFNPKGLPEVPFTCPGCKTGLKVFFRSTDSAETQLGGISATPAPVSGGDGKTQLFTPPGGGTVPPPVPQQHACLVCNGREYPLQLGENTVGRRSQQRPAAIMLDVNDSYMSRQHIVINVQQQNGKIHATVTNYRNTNETFVAGLPLAQKDVLPLNHGTEIKMGETTVIYRVQ